MQLGWGTADNASNNDTCMKATAREIDPDGLWWDPIERRVRCVSFLVGSVEKGLMRRLIDVWSIRSMSAVDILSKALAPHLPGKFLKR
jgi:hypothetical protein